MPATVRPLAEGDRAAWLPLWLGYLEFYETKLDARITEATWARLLDPHERMFGLVAETDGKIVGLLNYVLHANTWSVSPVCYLEDLFVAPDGRGQGAGRALIAALADLGRAAKWRRIYWQTRSSNATARQLYDKIGTLTSWVRYDIDL